jgi:hypothetical protein
MASNTNKVGEIMLDLPVSEQEFTCWKLAHSIDFVQHYRKVRSKQMLIDDMHRRHNMTDQLKQEYQDWVVCVFAELPVRIQIERDHSCSRLGYIIKFCGVYVGTSRNSNIIYNLSQRHFNEHKQTHLPS